MKTRYDLVDFDTTLVINMTFFDSTRHAVRFSTRTPHFARIVEAKQKLYQWHKRRLKTPPYLRNKEIKWRTQ